MTYGRFLEYLDMGWVKRVDLYDDGHTAIVEAIGPELGNRIQRIRVELPATAPELITKLRKAVHLVEQINEPWEKNSIHRS